MNNAAQIPIQETQIQTEKRLRRTHNTCWLFVSQQNPTRPLVSLPLYASERGLEVNPRRNSHLGDVSQLKHEYPGEIGGLVVNLCTRKAQTEHPVEGDQRMQLYSLCCCCGAMLSTVWPSVGD